MKRILFLLCALLAFAGGAKATEVVYSTSTGSYTATNPNGTWASKWVSTATNPQVTISVGANNIQVSSGNIYSGNSGCTYTIATEAGYMITGYTIVGKAQDAAQTLTPAEGGEAVTFNTDQDYTLTVSDIATQATSFTQSTPNKGIAITSFTITVEENPDYVDPFTLLSNEKAYKLTCPRGTLGVFDNTLVSTMQDYEASNFAVLKYNEAFYLYSIAAKRFINGSALASNYNLTAVDLQLQSDGSFLLVYNGLAINNNNKGTFMSTWGVSTGTPDDGNKFTIAEVEGETFDPTEALAILANPPAVPTYTYITSADNISNEKAYIVTNARGTWNVSTGADKMTTKSAIDLEALYEQFALIKKNDLIYIYSVNAKKFLTSSNTLGNPEPVTITSTGNDSYPFFFSFDASHNINVNGAGTVLIDNWSSIDGGNSNAIIEAADFDATEAMAQLNAYLLSQIESGDITEYILANPSFELSAADTPLTEEKKASNGALDIYGWTMEGVGSKYNDTELRNASSTSTTSQFGTSAPSDGDYALFFRQGWNGDGNTITLTAEAQAELAAGNYVLSADYKQHYSHDGNANSNTKVSLSVAGETVVSPAAAGVQGNSGDATYFNEAEWSTLSVPFTLDAAAKPSIVITLNAAGQRRSDFFLDNVRLVKVSEAELALMALNAALEPANATVAAKANVGDDLFQIPTAAFDTYKTAVAEQQAVAEKTDATAEELKAALTALNAATEAYNATETTKPDAGKFYTLQLKDGGMYMALNEGTKLAEEPTILSFEAVEGGYALTDGTSYVACTGTGKNVWSMAASTTPYAWQFAALGDGYYTIAKATNAAEFIGVDNTGAGSSCYANKPVSDMSTWKLAEFVPTPTLIEGVAQLNLQQDGTYDLGTVYSGDLTAAVTNVNSSTDITLKNVQYTLNMYGMEQTHQVGNITFAGLAVDAEGNINDTNVSVSFADGDLDGTWEAAAHTATSATVEGTLIKGKLAATFTVVADFTQSDPGYGDYTYSLTYTITFGDELPSFEYTREGLTVGNFGTIVLNFTPEATTGIGQLYSIAGKVSDEGGNPLYIVLQEETAIEAGVPYLFQADATTITATAPGTAASVTEPKNYEIVIGEYSYDYVFLNNGLQGTFTATTANDQTYNYGDVNVYFLSGGQIVKAAAESTLDANRAFIVMENVPEVTGDVKGLRIYLNDTTTGIQATKSADGKTVIFNLAGQRLQNAQKGINIVRGKKVLVK